MTTQTVALANEIMSQIQRNELFAIGAKDFIAIAPSDTYNGGLQFTISLFGRKKARLIILLNAQDLYDVAVYRGQTMAYIAGAKGVFAEDLTLAVVNVAEINFAK